MIVVDIICMIVGGILGTLLRDGISIGVKKNYHEYFDLGTLIANYLGCFFAGLVIPVETKEQWQKYLLTLFSVGFCGSLTTFSGYAGYVVTALKTKHVLSGLGVVLFTWIGCFFFVYIGFLITSTIKGKIAKPAAEEQKQDKGEESSDSTKVMPEL